MMEGGPDSSRLPLSLDRKEVGGEWSAKVEDCYWAQIWD
jgi:hypothetical protein